MKVTYGSISQKKQSDSEKQTYCPVCSNEITTNELTLQSKFSKGNTTTIEAIGKLPRKIAFRTRSGTNIHCPHCESEFMVNDTTKIHASIIPVTTIIALLCGTLIAGIIKLLQVTIKHITPMIETTQTTSEKDDWPTVINEVFGDAFAMMQYMCPITGAVLMITGMMNVFKSMLLEKEYNMPKGIACTILGGILMFAGLALNLSN